MIAFLLSLLVGGIAIIITAWLLPGINVTSFGNSILVAAVLALLNATVKPVLTLLTLPITIFTLGIFMLVINALVVMLAGAIVPGFSVDNFWWALLFSVVLSIVMGVFTSLMK
ncbi:MAG: phage holin family protein [Cyclobacteriaceae bacterium]|nr:phage holin family protein [Cyclobacteriaceae bacterium]MCH8517069.1 phage holin family protein [Cyclobacteriaceae bacterium]